MTQKAFISAVCAFSPPSPGNPSLAMVDFLVKDNLGNDITASNTGVPVAYNDSLLTIRLKLETAVSNVTGVSMANIVWLA